jgi:anti-sigma factor RsiW
MKCDAARTRMDAYADGEIPAWRRFALRRHLVACPACAAHLAEVRSRSERIRREVPRFAAPEGLRAKILASPDGSSPRVAPRRASEHRWRWVGAGALAGSVATVVVWLAGNLALDRRPGEDVAAAAVAAHVRATLSQELIQVASSDQHTVKPWLSARLDYSPPVRDFAAEGFPLVGARIDDIGGHPVATLVYRYREHTVDVFVRPDWLSSVASAPQTRRGFHVLRAEGQGMDWLLVSDAAAEAVAPLLRELASGSPAP